VFEAFRANRTPDSIIEFLGYPKQTVYDLKKKYDAEIALVTGKNEDKKMVEIETKGNSDLPGKKASSSTEGSTDFSEKKRKRDSKDVSEKKRKSVSIEDGEKKGISVSADVNGKKRKRDAVKGVQDSLPEGAPPPKKKNKRLTKKVKPSERSDYMQKLKTLIDAKPGVSTRVLAKELGVAHTTINKIRKNGIPMVVEAKKT